MSNTSATVSGLLSYAQYLRGSSDSAALDVELLLCHCLGKDRSYLRAWPQAIVPVAVVNRFMHVFARRCRGEPIAYLIGMREFWSLPLQVNSATLIPRPETERLVEVALQCVLENTPIKVLDLGTGTGAVALALASQNPQWLIDACDQVPAAVALARLNQQRLGIDNVSFYVSDWFSSVENKCFDMIVSNPPYMDSADPHLEQGDVRFEPRTALVAGKQGMAAIETIVKQSSAYLKTQGWLLIEHGAHQGSEVRRLLIMQGFAAVKTAQDLAGLDRVSYGQWHE